MVKVALKRSSALLLAVMLLAGCGSSSSTPRPTVTAAIGTSATAVHVLIERNGAVYVFRPDRVVITAGSTVEWTNQTDATQSVTAVDGSFDSAGLNRGRSFIRTFRQPGTYRYSSLFHSYMSGVVVVRS